MTIQAIVLDIGNVICQWDPDKLVQSALTSHPIASADASVLEVALNATVRHCDWLGLDRGTLHVEDAIARAQERARLVPELNPEFIAAIYNQLPESLTPIDTTVEAMLEANDAGIPLYILSNMPHHAWQYMHEKYSFWSVCTGIVVSSDTGYIKPEPEIFDHLCSSFGLDPQSCFFIDDLKENIEAAKHCGWQGEQLTDAALGGELIRKVAASIESK